MRNWNALFYKGIITSLFFLIIAAEVSTQCSVSAGNDITICQGQKFTRTATFTGTASTIKWYKKGSSSSLTQEKHINLTIKYFKDFTL